jgi:hypothetical protein
MSTHAYTEAHLVEQPAIGLFAATLILFKSLPVMRCNLLFSQCFLFK